MMDDGVLIALPVDRNFLEKQGPLRNFAEAHRLVWFARKL